METRAGSLDSTKVPRILNGTGSRTRAYLVEKGYEMISFLVKLLKTEWGLSLSEADIEKAHRLGVLNKTARNPRGIIFRVQNFQLKHRILQAVKVRRTHNINSEEQEKSKYRIFSDILVQMRKRRDAFWPLRERLHNLNITTKVKYPAVLLVQNREEELRLSMSQYLWTDCI